MKKLVEIISSRQISLSIIAKMTQNLITKKGNLEEIFFGLVANDEALLKELLI